MLASRTKSKKFAAYFSSESGDDVAAESRQRTVTTASDVHVDAVVDNPVSWVLPYSCDEARSFQYCPGAVFLPVRRGCASDLVNRHR